MRDVWSVLQENHQPGRYGNSFSSPRVVIDFNVPTGRASIPPSLAEKHTVRRRGSSLSMR